MNGNKALGVGGEGQVLRDSGAVTRGSRPSEGGGGSPPALVFRRATTPDDLQRVFRLRYQVYIVERGFERPEDHPGEIERDAFDAVSVHFLCERRDGLPIGTARLILRSPLGFPLEKHCTLSIDPAELPRDCLAEISRLAVTRQYQRRREDAFHPSPPSDVEEPAAPQAVERRRDDLVLGLYRELYRATKQHGITYWYVAMEDKLRICLRRLGFEFRQIGPYVQYHGWRAPFLGEISAIERIVGERFPDILSDFTRGLTNRSTL